MPTTVKRIVTVENDVPGEVAGHDSMLKKLEFWEFITAVPAEEWGKRWQIEVHRRNAGDQVHDFGYFVCKFRRQFSVEELIDQYGGGQYEFFTRRDGKIFRRDLVKIEGAAKIEQAPGASVGGANPVIVSPEGLFKAADKLMENMTGMQQRAFEQTLKAVSEQSNPSGMIEMLKALMALMAPQKNNLLETIQMLQAIGMVKKPEDPVDALTKMVDVMKKFGLGDSSPRNWKEVLAANLPETAKYLSQAVGEMGKAIQAQRAGETSVTVRQPQNGPHPAPGQPVALAGPQPVPNPAPAAPAGATTLESWIKSKVKGLIESGDSAPDVADWLERTSPEIFDYLKVLTTETLEQAFASDPVLSTTEFPEDKEAFFKAFLEYANEED